MMRVTQISPVEDCFDGSRVIEIHLDQACSRGLIDHLGSLGSLEYFGSFSRPFYRIRSKGRFVLRGVEGNLTFQVTVVSERQPVQDELVAHINRYQSDRKEVE